MISLPRGNPVRQNVNPARINLPEAMEKLRVGTFTGYLRFDAPQGAGVILFKEGQLISSIYQTAETAEKLIAYDAIARIFEIAIMGNAVLNIYRMSADLVLGIHALLHGRYLQQGADLASLDVEALLKRIREEGLTACLRVRGGEKTTLIFYDQGYPLGFFHDGQAQLEQKANLDMSLARQPGATLDFLEIRSADEIILADLMESADLGPIWQRIRKQLMEERRKREEEVVRTREQQEDRRRERTLTLFKTIAGNHIGKFGVTQVEKAFAAVGAGLAENELEGFYSELQKLARLVAGQAKISAMINEMRQQVADNP